MPQRWTGWYYFIVFAVYLRGASMQDVTFENYILVPHTVDYNTANTECSYRHAELAFFHTDTEYHRVVNYITKLISEGHWDYKWEVWIRINATYDKATSSFEFRWNYEKLGSDDWLTDEPNENCRDYEGENQCCARIAWKSQSPGLRDKNCSHKYSFLCQNNNIKAKCKDGLNQCDHKCVDTPQGYECECYSGYTLDPNNETCSDINECDNVPQPCHDPWQCINSEGSYVCVCPSGFENVNGLCVDTDECQQGTGNCSQECHNTEGGYGCLCHSGYKISASDNSTCEDVDECNEGTSACSQECENTIGGYDCKCQAGYIKSPTDKFDCQDVDECNETIHNCSQICQNTVGEYNCSCYDGYVISLLDDEVCDDVDECQEGTDSCEQICTNMPGGYNCSCRNGYRKSPIDTFHCDDVDECREGNHSCHQMCRNTAGSYSCACFDGFRLSSDNTSCHDIDECAESPDICQGHQCKNIVGSFICVCKEGFRLAADRVSCIYVQAPPAKVCPCSCSLYTLVKNISKYTFHEKTEEIKSKLRIQLDNLSSRKRRKSSTKDDRASSQTVGYFGVCVVATMLGLLIIPDVVNGLFYLSSKVGKLIKG